MAVVENAGVDLGVNVGSSLAGRSFGDEVPADRFDAAAAEPSPANDHEQAKMKHFPNLGQPGGGPTQGHGQLRNGDLMLKVQQLQQRPSPPAPLPQALGNHRVSVTAKTEMVLKNGMQGLQHGALVGGLQHRANGHDLCENGDVGNGDGFKRDMRELVDLLSKLNPMAEEFVPGSGGPLANNFVFQNNNGSGNLRRVRRGRSPIRFIQLNCYFCVL